MPSSGITVDTSTVGIPPSSSAESPGVNSVRDVSTDGEDYGDIETATVDGVSSPVNYLPQLLARNNLPITTTSTFPVKLFDLVTQEDQSIVGWQRCGTSFQVKDMERFVNEVLPKRFKRECFFSSFSSLSVPLLLKSFNFR